MRAAMKPPIPLRAMKVFWRKAVRTMPAAFILAVLLTLPALLLAQQKAEAGVTMQAKSGRKRRRCI
jgi:hypothetical protein